MLQERIHFSEGKTLHRLPGRDAYFEEGTLVMRYGSDMSRKLFPCTEIADLSLCLGFVANNKLKAKNLGLKNVDRNPITVFDPYTENISRLDYPGKSAVILTAQDCDRQLVGEFTEYFSQRKIDRTDHLHTATVGDLLNVGWVPYYTPLQIEGYVPHARLVSRRTITNSELPTDEDIKLLSNVFKKAV